MEDQENITPARASGQDGQAPQAPGPSLEEQYDAIFGPANAGPAPAKKKKALTLPEGVTEDEYRAALEMARGNENIIPPGAVAHRLMENMHVTPALFAEQLKMTQTELATFFAGGTAMTREIAITLRDITGVTIAFWTAAERQYRHRLDKEARRLLGTK